ncbi:MAG: transposase domain-containing protein [Bacillota bacterium]
MSDNRAERSIKPFVMDRKHLLFSNTPAGAQGSATIFSLIETAKENDLDPLRYLVRVFSILRLRQQPVIIGMKNFGTGVRTKFRTTGIAVLLTDLILDALQIVQLQLPFVIRQEEWLRSIL